MKLNRRIARLIAASSLAVGVLGATIVGATPASATTVRICGNSGTGYCLNDWGGHDFIGDPIKMEVGGVSNENFWVHHLTTFCGGLGYVGNSCTSQWGSQGSLVFTDDAVEIVYGPGGCLGSDSNGLAIITTCPNDSGVGGGTGTVFAFSDTTCFGCSKTGGFISRPWSNSSGQLAYLESGGAVGNQANEICSSGCTNWGGSGVPEQ